MNKRMPVWNQGCAQNFNLSPNIERKKKVMDAPSGNFKFSIKLKKTFQRDVMQLLTV